MSFFDDAPMFAADYYKIGHAVKMQPADAKMVYSTWTARSNKYHKDCAKTMVFGHQYTIQRLLNYWQAEFFNQPIDLLESEWNRVIKDTFHPGYADFSKFRSLAIFPFQLWEFPKVHFFLSVFQIMLSFLLILNLHGFRSLLKISGVQITGFLLLLPRQPSIDVS